MNPSETPTGAPATTVSATSVEPQSEMQELRGQIQCLRKLLMATLCVLLFLSASLNLYLLRQIFTVSRDLKGARPQVVQALDQARLQDAEINNFVAQLQAFARAHPDFNPILQKYGAGVQNGTTLAAPPPGN